MEFGPFGEPLYERGVVSNYIPFRLYGMYKDMETGLYYNVRRYYDWRVGRYLQPDPVSDLNLYVYVNNSPYDLVDPVGMFETTMQLYGALWHEGHSLHEGITEDAIRGLNYPKLSQYGFRVDNCWDNGPFTLTVIPSTPPTVVALQCRCPRDTVAQGVNRADCFFASDSSYHCDNSNFDGCSQKAQMIASPVSSGLVTCICTSPPGWQPPPPSYPPPAGGGPGKGEGGGGGGGCSVARLREKSSFSCSCSFQGGWNYEKLGRLLHAVQDFWAHSNGEFVSTCSKRECVSRVLVCLDWECAEYKVETIWNGSNVPSGSTANSFGLFTGLFGGGGWQDWEDVVCALPYPLYSSLRRYPPCNVGGKIMPHCMLNKDYEGGDNDCMSACDQGDWAGDCGGKDNIQRKAFNIVRNRAQSSSRFYLRLFCFERAGICY